MKRYGMSQNIYNYKHTQTPCPQCKTNTHTILDNIHAEIYCTKCGIIIHDTIPETITHEIEKRNLPENRIRNLHKKRLYLKGGKG